MFIHKTHSKNELVKIVEAFRIPITNPRQFRKVDLSALIVDRLTQMEYIVPCEEFWFCNITDLKLFLVRINPKKVLTIKEKNKVISICKKIKHYCRNGSDMEINGYKDISGVYEDAEYIKRYGDIPSVRKSLRELNKQYNRLYEIEPVVSPHVKKQLEQKECLRQKGLFKYGVEHGHFVLVFD